MVKENFLSNQKRYQPISLPQNFSDEEMARDWTLSEEDIKEINKFRKNFRLFVAIELCAIRLYGRFLNEIDDLSSRISNYLNSQLGLEPSLAIEMPERRATHTEHRKNILNYLGFKKFDDISQEQLRVWLKEQARKALLPDELFHKAENHLLASRIVLPGPSILEKLIVQVCSEAHTEIFESIYQTLSPDLRQTLDRLLNVPQSEQRSYFYQLKEYPPAATISSLQTYLKRYRMVAETGIDKFQMQALEPTFLNYLFKLTKKYSSTDLKRFNEHKRYALLICFLLETRKVLLDFLVKMHDQYITEICRESKHSYEKKHREFRKRHKKAVDTILYTTDILLECSEDEPLSSNPFWQQVDKTQLGCF